MNVRITKHARHDLDNLDAPTRSRMMSRLRDLAGNPRSVDLKKLEGEGALYLVRVGDYRAIDSLGLNRIQPMSCVLIIGERLTGKPIMRAPLGCKGYDGPPKGRVNRFRAPAR